MEADNGNKRRADRAENATELEILRQNPTHEKLGPVDFMYSFRYTLFTYDVSKRGGELGKRVSYAGTALFAFILSNDPEDED